MAIRAAGWLAAREVLSSRLGSGLVFDISVDLICGPIHRSARADFPLSSDCSGRSSLVNMSQEKSRRATGVGEQLRLEKILKFNYVSHATVAVVFPSYCVLMT